MNESRERKQLYASSPQRSPAALKSSLRAPLEQKSLYAPRSLPFHERMELRPLAPPRALGPCSPERATRPFTRMPDASVAATPPIEARRSSAKFPLPPLPPAAARPRSSLSEGNKRGSLSASLGSMALRTDYHDASDRRKLAVVDPYHYASHITYASRITMTT